MSIPNIFKVILLGDSSVGKTSILSQYINKSFFDKTKSTIGADFITHEIEVDGTYIGLQLWDTAGSERFQAVQPIFFRGSDCCILVCDVTNKETFEHLDEWKKHLLESLSNIQNENTFCFVVVGNKSDCESTEREVKLEELQQWDGGIHAAFECSAKTGWNIEKMFYEVAKLMKERRNEWEKNQTDCVNDSMDSLYDDIDDNKDQKSSCCN